MDKLEKQMDVFKAQMDDFERKLRLFRRQDISTLKNNITNLSKDVEGLQQRKFDRIIKKSEDQRKAEQIKADKEKATELNV